MCVDTLHQFNIAHDPGALIDRARIAWRVRHPGVCTTFDHLNRISTPPAVNYTHA